MKALLLALMPLLTSCAAGPEVYGSCSRAGLDEALQDACDRWPETCEIGQRMDFFCVSAEQIDNTSRCRHNVAECTMWLGTSQAYRGRTIVEDQTPLADAARHAAQHWHLWDDRETNACETHEASCGWEKD